MNTEKHVIDIAPDGNVRCVYTETINLAGIGALSIQRASNVEFNTASQQWEVRFTDTPDTVAYSAPTRAECIAWEVETLNRRLLQ